MGAPNTFAAGTVGARLDSLVFILHISFSLLFSYWAGTRVFGVFFAALGTGGWRLEDEGGRAGCWQLGLRSVIMGGFGMYVGSRLARVGRDDCMYVCIHAWIVLFSASVRRQPWMYCVRSVRRDENRTSLELHIDRRRMYVHAHVHICTHMQNQNLYTHTIPSLHNEAPTHVRDLPSPTGFLPAR